MPRPISVRGLAGAFIFLVVSVGTAVGQQPQDSVAPPPEEPAVAPLELAFSPRGAFFRSVLLPGWGQAYVGAPGRGAVYFGLASGSFVMTYVARRQLLDARTEVEWLRETGAIEPTADTELVLARERHFEDWAAISLFVMFLAGADAYVSAYLADFEDRIGVVPVADGSLELRVTLPLGRVP